MIKNINFGSITHLCFLGGTPLMADLINEAKDSFTITVITSKRFLNDLTRSNKLFSMFFEELDISYIVTDNIDENSNLVPTTLNTLAVCVSASWVFPKNFIDKFGGRFINIHRSYLPEFRGCASISWMFMQGRFESGYTFHLMTPKMDAGSVLICGKVFFQDGIPTMGKAYADLEKEIVIKFKGFISSIKRRETFKLIEQNEEASTYFPRLNQKIHAYINWLWSGSEIQKFIQAFSDPFGGGKTFLNGDDILIFIKEAGLIISKAEFHPFQYGIVCRKFNDELYIIVKGGMLKLKAVFSEYGVNITSEIKIGDRFHTPIKMLDRALMTRVRFDSDGNFSSDKVLDRSRNYNGEK